MTTQKPEERIVYQDEAIVLINKPSGLLSVSDGYDPMLPTLRTVFEPLLGHLLIVHRLDKETSGLILLARTPKAHASLNELFRKRKIDKSYFAIVSPAPSVDKFTIDKALSINLGRQHLTKADPNGKPACTDFTMLKRFSKLALLECRPKTGYRHQIRAHLYTQGFGIIGDKLYIPASVKDSGLPAARRMLLQSCALSFLHPVSKKTMNFQIDMDDDLTAYIELAQRLG